MAGQYSKMAKMLRQMLKVKDWNHFIKSSSNQTLKNVASTSHCKLKLS